MTLKESSNPVWQHLLLVCVPNKVINNYSLLYIEGGTNGDSAPTTVPDVVAYLCQSTQSIVSHLRQIPNQPIQFEQEGKDRVEDALIAYTWSHFLNDTSNPTWLARLPMTKAAVRAMDTVTALSKQLGVIPAEKFVVTGGSKRGWTTWTTGAVDKRVVGIYPIVIPVLNMWVNFNHHYQAYGEWSFALGDYLQMNLMSKLNDPIYQKLTAIIDPFEYAYRLTMPKMIVIATGDEFFLPDSTRFFYSGLKGVTMLHAFPNAQHSMAGHETDLIMNLETFYLMVMANSSWPTYSSGVQYLANGTAVITVTSVQKPLSVKLWHATTISHTKRDFRQVICSNRTNPDCIQRVIWLDNNLDPNIDGSYVATVDPPQQGWKGFMAEIDYILEVPGFGNRELKVTSQVYVVPDTTPFPPCGEHCQ